MQSHVRARSIPGLLVQLARLRPKLALGVVGLGLIAGLGLAEAPACTEPALEIATFNIREFPRGGARQIDGAFEAIAALDVPIVAVEEITRPAVFIAEAQRRLGSQWAVEFGPPARVQAPRRPPLHQGVLYDSSRFIPDGARLHRETVIEGRGGRPTLEVRLRPRDGRGPTLRVFVVHLKAGGRSADIDWRAQQLDALTPVVAAAVDSPDELVVLGDFNTTGPADRVRLAHFAAELELDWASEALECTAYWSREDGCPGSALDHVLSSRRARAAAARGPCETEGCSVDSCPIFHAEVSDHCPVTASF